MDSELLVEQKDDGRKLVEQLARDGIRVAAAFWALERGMTSWRLYVASLLIDERDMKAAYSLILPSIHKVPSKWASIAVLELRNSENPMVKAAVEIRDRDPDGRAVLYEGERLGNLRIQGAYIYPEIAPARLLFTVHYARIDESNQWNAEVRYEDSYPGLRLRGAISYATTSRDDGSPADARDAQIGVLVEIDPRFVPFSPRDRGDILAVAARQARRAADRMFKARHPEAVVVEAAEEHCLTP